MTVVNTVSDLANIVDSWIQDSQTKDIEEYIIASILSKPGRPVFGTDWTEFLDSLSFEELVAEAQDRLTSKLVMNEWLESVGLS